MIPYNTSGARDTIFMNCFSRSSLATGPKIRVPLGVLSSLMITAAFSSNLLVVDGQATRVGFTMKDGKKVRVAKKTGKVID